MTIRKTRRPGHPLRPPIPEMKSLDKVLEQSEVIKVNVEESAEDLSQVNDALTQERNGNANKADLQTALEQTEGIEDKVRDAADDLDDVNRALKSEVKERKKLEVQLDVAREQEQEARHAAVHDPLTSLPNRTLFNDRLEHGLAQAKRHGWILAVMYIDLDGFKKINDTHGHQAGDRVLVIIADRLQEMVRADDTVSRQGGDEFLYLLLELKNEADVAGIAENLIRRLGEPCDVTVDGAQVSLRAMPSIGVAIFPTDGTCVNSLLECADKAMYRAKQEKTGYALMR
ncbi:MAG: GGDEF domain-containing protein [Gemmatimonadota bacterium]